LVLTAYYISRTRQIKPSRRSSDYQTQTQTPWIFSLKMEAVRLLPYHSTFLRPKRLELAPSTFNGTHNNAQKRERTVKTFIVAALQVPVSPQHSYLPRLKVSPDSLQYPPGFLGASVQVRVRDDGEGGNKSDAMGYLTKIITSEVYDVAITSPLELAPKLSERLGISVWLKREDLQPVRLFLFYFVFFF
jgi:threonine dehydratase